MELKADDIITGIRIMERDLHALEDQNRKLIEARNLVLDEKKVIRNERDRLRDELAGANSALFDSMQTEGRLAARIAELERMAVSDVTVLRDERHHRSEVSEVLVERTNERDQAREQRDKLQGICERLKRELEDARNDINAVGMTQTRYYLEQQDALRKELREAREALGAARAFHDTRVSELTAELDDLRQAPSGTKKQADEIEQLHEVRRALERQREELIQELAIAKKKCDTLDHKSKNDNETILYMQTERDRLLADLAEQKAYSRKLETALNAGEPVAALAKERDEALERERKALWLLAGAVERAEVAEQRAKQERERRKKYREEMARKALDVHAAARTAESGGGLSGVTPPPPIRCDMPTPDGRCAEQAYDTHGHNRFCKRHLDAIRATDRT